MVGKTRKRTHVKQGCRPGDAKWLDHVGRAGELAEQFVLKHFGVGEPVIEIKACRRQYHRVVIKADQFERSRSKVYAIVSYNRPRISKRRPKELTMEEAFAESLHIYFIPANHLRRLFKLPGSIKMLASSHRLTDWWRIPIRHIQAQLEATVGPRKAVFSGDMPHFYWGHIPPPF